MTLDYNRFLFFLLVLTRMSGVFLFNPLLGRRNVPTVLKIALALVISALVVPTVSSAGLTFPTTLSFLMAVLREMLAGMALGLLMNMFLSSVLMAGEVMDMEMGTSISKVYDPQSGVSMPLTGTAYNVMLTLIFFAANGHLTLIRIAADSIAAFPPGTAVFNFSIGEHLFQLFGDILILMLKLAMPVIAIELFTEAGLGVLMRIVPQINMFVAGLQLKLIVGFLVIILALQPLSQLMDTTIQDMFRQMQAGITLMMTQE